MHQLRPIPPLLLLAALGCAPEPPPGPETDVQPLRDAEWPVAGGGRLVLDGATLSFEPGDGQAGAGPQGHRAAGLPKATLLADELVGDPAISADGARVALSRRGPGPGLAVLDLVSIGEGGVEQRTLVEDGAPDRAAISADGAWVAWVSGQTGIASVWAMPVVGGAAVQLTNRDLVRVIGEEPVGFVPPPHAGPLEIVGHEVRWTSPAGAHAVALP